MPNGQANGRTGRWPRILLIVSLTVNVLIIGGLAGFVVKWPRHDGRDVGHYFGPAGLKALANGFEIDDRRELRRLIGGKRQQMKDRRIEAEAAFSNLLAALRAEPFDPSAITEIFEQQRHASHRVMVDGHELLAQRITAMDPDRRHQFADRLEQRYLHRKR